MPQLQTSTANTICIDATSLTPEQIYDVIQTIIANYGMQMLTETICDVCHDNGEAANQKLTELPLGHPTAAALRRLSLDWVTIGNDITSIVVPHSILRLTKV